MKRIIYLLAIGMITSCTSKKVETNNPLLKTWDTPFGVVPFEQVKPEHYLPAFEQGIAEHNTEIEAIANSTEEPTFANTILALEYAGQTLNKVSSVFGNQTSANTNDSLQALAKEIMPRLSAHSDGIYLNDKLFQRVKTVFDQKENLNLQPEELKLLEETHKEFVNSGANLSPEKKEELKKINEQLSLLSVQFGDNLLSETNSFKLVIDNEADLAGLPESVVAGAAETAKAANMEGKWVFTLHAPSWIPFLQYSEKRELREKLYKAMYSRGNNGNDKDNNAIINQIIQLRLQRAHIMGYPNHAAYALNDRMAKNPENVYNLLNQLWTPALANAKAEAKDMQAMIKREGGNFELASWDWWFYAEKVRKEKYNLDEAEIRPYFELNNVREGAFTLANKLWNINFKPIENIPVPHPDAKAFEVLDADGSHIGVLYMDFHPRESKRGGAWMSSYRKQSRSIEGENVAPVITVVCNFSKPTGDQPALLSYDEVETLFHEFGHALHGLLSNCQFQSLSGTSVPRDFVELPSQIMENWCTQPEMLKLFAKHYQTGEVIPQTLVDKLLAASKFNQGFATVEYLAASILDMDYHTLTEAKDMDLAAFEKASMDKIGLIDQIIPRYKTTYFNHIWGGGYSAGYYSYIWAEVLDADAFEAFIESGDIFNQEVAKSYRDNILSRGGTRDAMEMYKAFRGKEPSIEPLLKNRGLK